MADDANKWRPNNGSNGAVSFRWIANGLIAFVSVAAVSLLGWVATTTSGTSSRIEDLKATVEMMDYKVSQLQVQATASGAKQEQMQAQFTDLASKFTDLTGRFTDLTAKYADNSAKLVQLQTQLNDTAFKASTSQDWIQGTIKSEQGIGTIQGTVPVRKKHGHQGP